MTLTDTIKRMPLPLTPRGRTLRAGAITTESPRAESLREFVSGLARRLNDIEAGDRTSLSEKDTASKRTLAEARATMAHYATRCGICGHWHSLPRDQASAISGTGKIYGPRLPEADGPKGTCPICDRTDHLRLESGMCAVCHDAEFTVRLWTATRLVEHLTQSNAREAARLALLLYREAASIHAATEGK
jgi:hypothetical protein